MNQSTGLVGSILLILVGHLGKAQISPHYEHARDLAGLAIGMGWVLFVLSVVLLVLWAVVAVLGWIAR